MMPRPASGTIASHLLDFLPFALTNHGDLGHGFLQKYGAVTDEPETVRLCGFIRSVLDRDLEGDPAETLAFLSLLHERETAKDRTRNLWTLVRGGYFRYARRHGVRKRKGMGTTAILLMRFHTARSGAATLYSQERGMTDAQSPWRIFLAYSFRLRAELIRALPEHRELISGSWRAKIAELYLLKGFRPHAGRRYQRLLARLSPTDPVVKHLLADVHYHYATTCETPDESLHHHTVCLNFCNELPISRERVRLEIQALADRASLQEGEGGLREASAGNDRALFLIETCQDFWTPAQSAGWIVQRSWLAGEALCRLGKYQAAADRFEKAIQAIDRLEQLKQASRLPHQSLGAYLRMRVELIRSPVHQSGAIRKRHLETLERELAATPPAADDPAKAFLKFLFKPDRLWRLLVNRRQTVMEIHQYLTGISFMTEKFQQKTRALNTFKAELELLESYGTAGAETYFEGLDIAPDSAFVFRFVLEGIIRSIRSGGEAEGWENDRLGPGQIQLLRIALRNERHLREDFPAYDPSQGIREAMAGYEFHLPEELFHLLRYLAQSIRDNPVLVRGEFVSNLAAIFDAAERASVNYSHPEDAYLVSGKLRQLYEDFAEALAGALQQKEHVISSARSWILDAISVCVERSGYRSRNTVVGKECFTAEELQLESVKKFLHDAGELETARLRLCFPDFEMTDVGSGCDYFSQRLGTVSGASHREATTRTAVKILRACQKNYSESWDEISNVLPDFSPPHPYLRKFGQQAPDHRLQLHLFVMNRQLVCIGYQNGGVSGNWLSPAGSEEILDVVATGHAGLNAALWERLGSLIDDTLASLPAMEVEGIEWFIQPPFEAIPWLLLRDWVQAIHRKTPYRYDVGVGFSTAVQSPHESMKGVKTQTLLVIGPPFDRTDLPFASLEFHTAWQESGELHRLALPVEGGELMEAITPVGVLHVTGHIHHHESSPLQSAIKGKASDSQGISLGFLQAGNFRLPGSLVILNLCHSGRSGSGEPQADPTTRISDQPRAENAQAATPKAFAATFLAKGASSVIATLWEVDDVSSFLFMRKLSHLLGSGTEVGQAVEQAAFWLRNITSAEAVSWIDAALETVAGELQSHGMLTKPLMERRHAIAAGTETPFSHPSFWAAYAVYGRGDL